MSQHLGDPTVAPRVERRRRRELATGAAAVAVRAAVHPALRPAEDGRGVVADLARPGTVPPQRDPLPQHLPRHLPGAPPAR